MKPTIYIALAIGIMLNACQSQQESNQDKNYPATVVFPLYKDPNRFADIALLRYKVNGFEQLTLQQKALVYYLSEAALCGRDIIYDQNNRNNLRLRTFLESLYSQYNGDRTSDDFKRFEVFLKRFWMSNGIHHHYSETKIQPEFSSAYFEDIMKHSPGSNWPMPQNIDTVAFKTWAIELLFNPNIEAKRVNKSDGVDPIAASANHFYEGLSKAEVDAFYAPKKQNDTIEPLSWGLNSTLSKDKATKAIKEKTWKVGGMYSAAISKMVEWLEKAMAVAETKEQATALKLLIDYYNTGDLKTWDNYNIAWVKDINSTVDYINGFIEVYHDAIGMRAGFESAVEINDFEASKRMSILAQNAQWFEDHSPIETAHKKQNVTGITYKVVNVVMEGGDLAPSTAIGINLPNAEWIREKHGSKSVSLGNIVEAYNSANSGGLLKEFCYSEEEVKRAEQFGQLAGKLHTAMHEVIGHASGQMNKGVTKDNLGQYGSTLEEARADLVALYYLMDQKLVELGVMPSLEVGKAEYDEYIRNGMMVQLRRLRPGESIEEDHMRNRQMVAQWVYEAGKEKGIIEQKIRDNKTYYVINDYEQLRQLFGELLKQIQTIKSTGNEAEGKKMVEQFGVKVNANLHTEVLKRSKALDIAAYRGFIQPKLSPVYTNGQLTDVTIDYNESFIDQMLRYSKDYHFLPLEN